MYVSNNQVTYLKYSKRKTSKLSIKSSMTDELQYRRAGLWIEGGVNLKLVCTRKLAVQWRRTKSELCQYSMTLHRENPPPDISYTGLNYMMAKHTKTSFITRSPPPPLPLFQLAAENVGRQFCNNSDLLR